MKTSANPKLFMGLALVSVIAGSGAMYFQYNLKASAEERVAKLRKSVHEEKAILAQLETSEVKLRESAEKLNHLEKGVPGLAYIPTLLTELEQTGKQNNIEVLGVRPMPPKVDPKAPKDPAKKKSYEELDIEVKGRGNYRAIMTFLSALKAFPKIVAVRTTTLTPKHEINETGPPKLDVTVELRAYLFPPTEGEKPGVQKTAEIGGQHGIG